MLISRIRIRHRLSRITPFLGALAATAALAPAAQADTPAAPCEGALTQAFSAWDDFNHYALAPGGDFESDLADWRLAGASQVDGSEPYGVTGSVGASSLSIDEGGVAISAPTCIDSSRETMRMFTRSDSDDARLRIDVLYVKNGKKLKSIDVDTIGSQADWQPSPIVEIPLDKVLKHNSSNTAEVYFRLTGKNGSIQVDDLMIDPRFNR